MKKNPSISDQSSFVFNIEVLVEGKNNAAALEQLLHALNNANFVDFRIQSGIQLGEQIELRTKNASSVQPVAIPSSMDVSVTNSNPIAEQQITKDEKNKPKKSNKPAPDVYEDLSYFDKIKAIMKNNTLIRLIVNKGLGIKLNIPCRIINMDEAENIITVYHVDEKQVYTFRLNEIEDFSY
jgi:hypothetical protein